MPTYRITGIDKSTRLDTSLAIHAASRHDAIDEAMARGVMPGTVELTSFEPPYSGAAGSAVPAAAKAVRSGGVHPRRMIVACAALLGASATFMPWVKAPLLGNVAGTVGDGWLSFGAFLLMLALVFSLRIFDHPGAPFSYRADMSPRRCYAIAALGLGIIGLGIFELFSIYNLFEKLEGGPESFRKAFASATQPGFGLFIVLLCGIAAVWVSLMRFPSARSSAACVC